MQTLHYQLSVIDLSFLSVDGIMMSPELTVCKIRQDLWTPIFGIKRIMQRTVLIKQYVNEQFYGVSMDLSPRMTAL